MFDRFRKMLGYSRCERCRRWRIHTEGDWCCECIEFTTHLQAYLIGSILIKRVMGQSYKQEEDAAVTGLAYDFPLEKPGLKRATIRALALVTIIDVSTERNGDGRANQP